MEHIWPPPPQYLTKYMIPPASRSFTPSPVHHQNISAPPPLNITGPPAGNKWLVLYRLQKCQQPAMPLLISPRQLKMIRHDDTVDNTNRNKTLTYQSYHETNFISPTKMHIVSSEMSTICIFHTTARPSRTVWTTGRDRSQNWNSLTSYPANYIMLTYNVNGNLGVEPDYARMTLERLVSVTLIKIM